VKEIRAYVKPYLISSIIQELLDCRVFNGISYSKCRGVGEEQMKTAAFKEKYDVLYDVVRLDIFAKDDDVERIISILSSSAHTGLPGDGVIFISNVNEGIRISTGERGVEI